MAARWAHPQTEARKRQLTGAAARWALNNPQEMSCSLLPSKSATVQMCISPFHCRYLRPTQQYRLPLIVCNSRTLEPLNQAAMLRAAHSLCTSGAPVIWIAHTAHWCTNLAVLRTTHACCTHAEASPSTIQHNTKQHCAAQHSIQCTARSSSHTCTATAFAQPYFKRLKQSPMPATCSHKLTTPWPSNA